MAGTVIRDGRAMGRALGCSVGEAAVGSATFRIRRTSPLNRGPEDVYPPRAERMKLHVIYRSTGRENMKRRPSYFSKLTCLASFLRAVSGVEATDMIFLNDGEMPSDRERVMEAVGEIVPVSHPPGIDPRRGRYGLYGSYVNAIQLVQERSWAAEDLVYLAEDDYLYEPDCFIRLVEAAAFLKNASYFAFYATIPWRRTKGFGVNDELWHTAESTTSSFGARVRALNDDRLIHRVAFRVGHDTDVCLAYQGVAPFSWGQIVGQTFGDSPDSRSFRARARGNGAKLFVNLLAMRASLRPQVLVAPYHPLATHVELPYLAAGIDWELVARESASWLESTRPWKRGGRSAKG